MKITDLNLNEKNTVETDTDAYHVISNEYQRDSYIALYGNVEIEYDEKYKVYRSLCPDMEDKREKFLEAKLSYIRQYGSC